MIKKLVQHFKKRNDMRLRKWCIKLAAEVKSGDIDFCISSTANKIYKWVKGQPESES